jgi:hypothetical protein
MNHIINDGMIKQRMKSAININIYRRKKNINFFNHFKSTASTQEIMSEAKSTAMSNSGDAASSEIVSAQSIGATPDNRTNIQMVQNVLLI